MHQKFTLYFLRNFFIDSFFYLIPFDDVNLNGESKCYEHAQREHETVYDRTKCIIKNVHGNLLISRTRAPISKTARLTRKGIISHILHSF